MKTKNYSASVFFLFCILFSYGQKETFNVKILSSYNFRDLDTTFTNYDLLEIDTKEIFNYVKKGVNPTLHLNIISKFQADIQLKNNDQIIENMIVRNNSEIIDLKDELSKYSLFAGNNDLNERHSFVFNKDFFYGYFEKDGILYYIEPITNFIKTHQNNFYVMYKSSDIKTTSSSTCGVINLGLKNNMESILPSESSGFNPETSYNVRYAMASDYSMYQKFNYNGAQLVMYNVAIMQGAWGLSGYFSTTLFMSITEFYLAQCPSTACQPYKNFTSSSQRIQSFRDWALDDGFSNEYEIGCLLTNETLGNSSTILGQAYTNGFCTNYNFMAIKDYSTSIISPSPILYSVFAHEYGHLFNAQHDNPPTNCIMNASTSGYTGCWSQQSLNAINYDIQHTSSGCFGPSNKPINIASESSLTIYPNPTYNRLTINSSNLKISEWKFFDYSGMYVFGKLTDSKEKEIIINTSSLPKGFYILSITYENGENVNKTVLKN